MEFEMRIETGSTTALYVITGSRKNCLRHQQKDNDVFYRLKPNIVTGY